MYLIVKHINCNTCVNSLGFGSNSNRQVTVTSASDCSLLTKRLVDSTATYLDRVQYRVPAELFVCFPLLRAPDLHTVHRPPHYHPVDLNRLTQSTTHSWISDLLHTSLPNGKANRITLNMDTIQSTFNFCSPVSLLVALITFSY